MWLLYVILSGVFYTAQGLLTRHILKGEKDSWAFSFYFSFIGAVVSFPFMLVSPHLPSSISGWILGICISLLIVAHNFFNFRASNTLEASIVGAVTKFRLIWVFILGIIFLHEAFTFAKTLGILFTILAGWLIVKKFKSIHQSKGILYTFISTIIYAVIIVLYKYLFTFFNVTSATFFIVFLFPAIINIIIMPRFKERVIKIMRHDGKFVLLATGLGGFANLAINQSLSLGEVSRVTVINEAFLISVLIFEHLLLKERSNMKTKLIAVILAVVGAILMV